MRSSRRRPACGDELGKTAEASVRCRDRGLRALRRGAEDHRQHRGAAADCEDPVAPGARCAGAVSERAAAWGAGAACAVQPAVADRNFKRPSGSRLPTTCLRVTGLMLRPSLGAAWLAWQIGPPVGFGAEPSAVAGPPSQRAAPPAWRPLRPSLAYAKLSAGVVGVLEFWTCMKSPTHSRCLAVAGAPCTGFAET